MTKDRVKNLSHDVAVMTSTGERVADPNRDAQWTAIDRNYMGTAARRAITC